jgi:cutinase
MHFKSSLLMVALPLIAASPHTLDRRQLATADTENDLTNKSACKAMTVIFARGTTESGNVGTLSGPPFFGALAQQVGASNVAVQGVEYGKCELRKSFLVSDRR